MNKAAGRLNKAKNDGATQAVLQVPQTPHSTAARRSAPAASGQDYSHRVKQVSFRRACARAVGSRTVGNIFNSVDEAIEHLLHHSEPFKPEDLGTTSELIPGRTGVYTAWLDDQLIYVGCARVDSRDTPNKQADGVRGRLRDQALRGRMKSVIALRCCDRFILPSLTTHETQGLADGNTDLDRITSEWIEKNLHFRAVHTEDGRLAQAVEDVVRAGATPLGAPLLNPRS